MSAWSNTIFFWPNTICNYNTHLIQNGYTNNVCTIGKMLNLKKGEL